MLPPPLPIMQRRSRLIIQGTVITCIQRLVHTSTCAFRTPHIHSAAVIYQGHGLARDIDDQSYPRFCLFRGGYGRWSQYSEPSPCLSIGTLATGGGCKGGLSIGTLATGGGTEGGRCCERSIPGSVLLLTVRPCTSIAVPPIGRCEGGWPRRCGWVAGFAGPPCC